MDALLNETVNEYILDHLSNSARSGVISVCSSVQQRAQTMSKIVEKLGSFLTSTELDRRMGGCRFLADIVHRLPATCLGDKESELLALYFNARLSDHHLMQPIGVLGLLPLLIHHKLQDTVVLAITKSLVSEVTCQSLTRSDRHTYFCVFMALITSQYQATRTLGADLVFSFVQSMDGEKDPRNLLVCFQIVKQLLMTFPYQVFAEDLFEVTSCYFPIDFAPATDDPQGVQPEQLVLLLREIFTLATEFAPLCMSLLMEKMTSDHIPAKLDAMLTLKECCLSYPVPSWAPFLDAIWSVILGDVFLGRLEQLEKPAFSLLESLFCSLFAESTQSKSPFLITVSRDCQKQLTSEDASIVQLACSVLLAISRSSAEVWLCVMEETIRSLKDMLVQRPPPILEVLHRFLPDLFKLAETYEANQSNIDAVTRLVLLSKSIFLPLLTTGDQMQALFGVRVLSVGVLRMTLSRQDFLCAVGVVQQYSAVVFDSPELTSNIKDLFELYPDLVVTNFLAPSVHALLSIPEEANITSTFPDTTLFVLIALSCPAVSVRYTPELLTTLLAAMATSPRSALPAIEILLLRVVQTVVNIPACLEVCAEQMLDLALLQAPSLLESNKDISTECFSESITFVFCRLDGSQLHPRIDAVIQTIQDCADQRTAHLLIYLLCFLPVTGGISPGQSVQLCTTIDKAVVQDQRNAIALTAWKLLSTLTNKFEDEHLESFVTRHAQCLVSSMLQGDSKTISPLVLLLKGRLLRWHPNSSEYVALLVNALTQDNTSQEAAEAFSSILSATRPEADDLHLYPRVWPLFRQRFITEAVALIKKALDSNTGLCRPSYLVALAHLFKFSTPVMLAGSLQTALPSVLRQAVLDPTRSTRSSTIRMVSLLVTHSPHSIESIVDHVVSFCLSALSDAGMNERLVALNCLVGIARLSTHLVFPHKNAVVQAVAQLLGDQKRLVRQMAVACRNEWFLLGSRSKVSLA